MAHIKVVVETSIWQHNIHNRQTSMPRWDLDPQPQQAIGRRSTRSMRSANEIGQWDRPMKSCLTQKNGDFLRTVDGNVTKVERNLNKKKGKSVKGKAM